MFGSRLRMVVPAVVVIALSSLPAQEPEAPRFIFDLTDGSSLVGRLSLKSLAIQSSLGRVEVPLARLTNLEFTDNQGTATVLLDNGDKLSGRLDLSKLEFVTVFGKVTAEARLIKRIGKYSGRDQKIRELLSTPEKKREMAQTVLNEMRQVDAAKDQYALENTKTGNVVPAWNDLTPYLKSGSRLAEGGGMDSLGNPIQINAISSRLTVSPDTKVPLSETTGGDAFWGPYS